MSIERNLEPTPLAPEETAEQPFQYSLLTGHHRTDGSMKTTEELHTEYIRLTDELVRSIEEGATVKDNETGEATQHKADYVVWLDKSARPLAWLTHDLWPLLAADKDGNVPKEPQHRFVNIDRNQWTSIIDEEGVGRTDVASIDQSIIRSLRSIFLANPRDRDNGLTEAIDDAPSQFDDKTVLIVDEVRSSGRTLQYAEAFFKRAFPKANILGAHWMGKPTVRGGAVGNADQPVWYSDTTDLGRGVANRNIDLSLQSENPVQRLGAYFLSAALQAPDPLSQKLRTELHQLSEDARARKVFIEPSLWRDESDYDERAVRLNGLANFGQYIEAKKSHSSSKVQ